MDDSAKNAPSNAQAGAQETAAAPRDLSFLWPVIDRIRAVEIKLHDNGGAPPQGAASAAPASGATPLPADVDARLKALESDVAAIKQTLENAIGVLSRGVSDAAAAVVEMLELPPQSLARATFGAVVAIALLLAAHYVIVFVYDLSTVKLRLASIAIPLAIGVWLTLRRQIKPWFEVAVAVAIGLIAVFGMSYVTAVQEKNTFLPDIKSVLPENMREWRETLEYVASIAFAYLTGVLISGALQARSGARNRAGAATLKLAQTLASVTGKAISTGPELKKRIDQIHSLVNNLMPVATAVAAVVTGLKGVLN